MGRLFLVMSAQTKSRSLPSWSSRRTGPQSTAPHTLVPSGLTIKPRLSFSTTTSTLVAPLPFVSFSLAMNFFCSLPFLSLEPRCEYRPFATLANM